MINLYVSASGVLCKPFFEVLKNTCERGQELGCYYVLGIGGFKDNSRNSIDGETMIFIDEFLTRKS